ncbi:MAG: nucleotidyltransferase domain-containing protein [Chloroflexi bacterium]|nr:nucleotidyltransferase domain-containing protein [Chloroflexota bacterium]
MCPAIPESVARLIQDVQAWAETRPDVLGVALVGSYARRTARSDSDVDLVIVCESPSACLENAAWIGAFGRPMRIEREDWGRVQSVRVWYAGGPEVEFGVADAAWAEAPLDEGTQRVVEDGCIVLFDRGGAFAGLG